MAVHASPIHPSEEINKNGYCFAPAPAPLLLLLLMMMTMDDGGRKGEFMLFRLWNTPKPPTGKTKAAEVEFPEYSSVLSVISWAEKVIT